MTSIANQAGRGKLWKQEKGAGQNYQPHHQGWWADQCHLPIAPLPASHPSTVAGPCCWAGHSLPRAHMGSCHTRSHWTCDSTGPLHLTGPRILSVMLLKELTTASYCTGRIGRGGMAGEGTGGSLQSISCAFFSSGTPPAETSCKYTRGAVGKKYSPADPHNQL